MTTAWRLIADIGGTNARFARSDEGGTIVDQWTVAGADYPDFSDALEAYLNRLDDRIVIASAAVAAAGPVTNGEVRLTNSRWHITDWGIANMLGGETPARLLNDLEAVACALPYLDDADIAFDDGFPVTGQRTRRDRMLAVNIGTGFGSAVAIRAGSSWVACPSEAGHIPLYPADDEERALLDALGIPDLTVEDVLSGAGVRRLAEGLGAAAGDRIDLADASPLAAAVAGCMTRILARTCSNLVLASAAWDGVYLCGSVAEAWWRSAERDAFRSGFVGRSKMSHRLAATPVGLITAGTPALIGLSRIRIGTAVAGDAIS